MLKFCSMHGNRGKRSKRGMLGMLDMLGMLGSMNRDRICIQRRRLKNFRDYGWDSKYVLGN